MLLIALIIPTAKSIATAKDPNIDKETGILKVTAFMGNKVIKKTILNYLEPLVTSQLQRTKFR